MDNLFLEIGKHNLKDPDIAHLVDELEDFEHGEAVIKIWENEDLLFYLTQTTAIDLMLEALIHRETFNNLNLN